MLKQSRSYTKAAFAVAVLISLSDSAQAGTLMRVYLQGIRPVHVPTAVEQLSASSLVFNPLTYGSTETLQLTLSNTGDASLLPGPLNQLSAPFDVVANTCTENVAPGANCSVTVQFSPTSVGAFSGLLSIPSNVEPQSVSLSGTALGIPAITYNPTAPEADLTATTSSASGTFTISNPGSATLVLGTITATPDAPGTYAFSATGCNNASIAAGMSCTATLNFSATTVGSGFSYTGAYLNIPTNIGTQSLRVFGFGTQKIPGGVVH